MQAKDILIPRQVIWSDPEKFMVKLSPNGKYISYLAPYEGCLNLWVAPLSEFTHAKPITMSRHPLKEYWWSMNSDRLLYQHDHFGDENWQLFGYALAEEKTIAYSQLGCQSRIFKMSASKPLQILVGLNERDRRYFDVYLLDLATANKEMVYKNTEYWDFYADKDLRLRIGLKADDKGGEYVDLSDPDEPMSLTRVEMLDISGLYFYPRLRLGISYDNRQLYLTQSQNSNTSVLISFDLKERQMRSLGMDPTADICDVLINPLSGEPDAFATNYERKKWHGLHTLAQNDFDHLKRMDDGDIDILSQSTDNQHWLVCFQHDLGANHYYHYSRQDGAITHLFNSRLDLKSFPFTKMHPRIITSRDGMKCVSYLSLPREMDVNEKGTPPKPLPLVLMVHGGPHYRDFWGFNPFHQWLANRGYAVLSVNYRGSTGFGKAHMTAAFGEWGRKIQWDLLDAVEWAIKEGITTADQVAIMGRSFGGYTTLVALTMTPEVFCCGVDIVGPSNLETMVKHFPPYWKTVQGAIFEMIGCDPDTPEGKTYLKARSPLYYANRIQKPLLIGHGANDARIRQEESDQMVEALLANKIPVTYALFPDEGHLFLRPGNRLAFYALVEAFLARVLGGRLEPYDENVSTSMQVVVDDFGLGDIRAQ